MVKIFVGRLADDVNKSDLENLFKDYGEVTDCSVLKNYGFVHMADLDEAKAALTGLDKKELKGNNINVELSTTRVQKATKLFVGGLGEGAKSSDIHKLFKKYGTVIECDVIRNYAFVHMGRESMAREAIEGLNGTTVNGNKIAVQMARPKPGEEGPPMYPGDFRGRGRGRASPPPMGRGLPPRMPMPPGHGPPRFMRKPYMPDPYGMEPHFGGRGRPRMPPASPYDFPPPPLRRPFPPALPRSAEMYAPVPAHANGADAYSMSAARADPYAAASAARAADQYAAASAVRASDPYASARAAADPYSASAARAAADPYSASAARAAADPYASARASADPYSARASADPYAASAARAAASERAIDAYAASAARTADLYASSSVARGGDMLDSTSSRSADPYGTSSPRDADPYGISAARSAGLAAGAAARSAEIHAATDTARSAPRPQGAYGTVGSSASAYALREREALAARRIEAAEAVEAYAAANANPYSSQVAPTASAGRYASSPTAATAGRYAAEPMSVSYSSSLASRLGPSPSGRYATNSGSTTNGHSRYASAASGDPYGSPY